jgi:hypothetical protein
VKDHHELMAEWASDCAEHVLPLFSAHSLDDRPRKAIAIARAWARGEVSVGEARQAAFAAHAAAREATEKPAVAVARATGHAVATAHMADHCLAAAHYALKARTSNQNEDSERSWQLDRLPDEIRPLIESELAKKYPEMYRSD